jgi:hypothetical protein
MIILGWYYTSAHRHVRSSFAMLLLSVALSTFGLIYALPHDAAPHLADSTKVQASTYKWIFFFGNSYTNVGFDPNGAEPSPSNPFGNTDSDICGNTDLTGGPNWAVHLTNKLNSTPILAYDFAFNCATVDKTVVDVSGPGRPCACTEGHYIVDQVQQFKQVLEKGSDEGIFTEINTLFAVWIGINDAHQSHDRPDVESLMGEVVTRYFDQLDILYGLGARNFLLLGVPRKQLPPIIRLCSSKIFNSLRPYSRCD